MSTAKRTKKPQKTSAKERRKPGESESKTFGFYLSIEARERLERHAEFLTRELSVPVSASSALERLLLKAIAPDGQFQEHLSNKL
jgi:hypothetical protein